MNLIALTTTFCGHYSNHLSTIPDFMAIFISIIATFIALLATRFQGLSLIQSQISEKARECNTNIDCATHAIIETPQNISHVVSTIITTEQLINKTVTRGKLYFFKKQSLIDSLYLQLHTSIIEYIIKNTITSTFEEGQVKFHIQLQLDYCNKLFTKSIKRFGNATPNEIQVRLDEYKKSNLKK